MAHCTVSRSVEIPDHFRLARYLRTPEYGPCVLFFSGGSAIKTLSRKLVDYTHNSMHIVTPFDSGGSSAIIRDAFGMLSVGDIRNRLMALADQSIQGNPSVYTLFAYRFPKRANNDELTERLRQMANGRDSLILHIPNPMRRIIRNHLHFFLDRMPQGFDLRGASIGNLVLAGGYMNNRRHIDPVIFMFSKLVQARGTVKPVTGLSYHLAAELKNGQTIVGQHRISGHDCRLPAPIKRIFLTESPDSTEEAAPTIKMKIRSLIADAHLICYPIGSFYTSVMANLLPHGVARAVAANHCPKVYIPNSLPDPEERGHSLFDKVSTLLEILSRHSDTAKPPTDYLSFVLMDLKNGNYRKPFNLSKIRKMGIQIIDQPFISPRDGRIDEQRVIEILLSLT